MGQIIKSVCVCQSVFLSVCLSVCLFVCEHSHGCISSSIFTKIGTDVRTPKRKNKFVRGQYRTTPSPILSPKTPILGQEVLKTHANIKQCYICLKCTRIAEIYASYKKSGSMNTMVTSDFRPEVKIRPFCACAMKNTQYNSYLWPNRRNFRDFKEIWVEKHDGDVRF